MLPPPTTLLLLPLLALLSACGDETIAPPHSGAAADLPGLETDGPVGSPAEDGIDFDVVPGEDGAPDGVTDGAFTPPTGGTFFDLVAVLPPGARPVPLRARLQNSLNTVILSSVAVTGGTWPGTRVEPGTYRLTFLDDEGDATGFTRLVNVREGRGNFLTLGGIWVHPRSSAFSERVAVESLRYQISSGGFVLKTTRADLNRVILLPPGNTVWELRPLGRDPSVPLSDFALPPMRINAGSTIVPVEFGSLMFILDTNDVVRLETPGGGILYDQLESQVEYLLPISPQAEGCYVYLAVINTLVFRTLTLCSDATRHVRLNLSTGATDDTGTDLDGGTGTGGTGDDTGAGGTDGLPDTGQTEVGVPEEDIAGTPGRIVGTPGEIVGRPGEVVGTPGEIVGTPGVVITSE